MGMDILSGVATGVASAHAIDASKKLLGAPDMDKTMMELLAEIARNTSPREKYNIDIPILLQQYPLAYRIDDDWMDRPHFCIFLATPCALKIETQGAGTYTQSTMLQGWIQVDLRGWLYSTCPGNTPAIVSYRYDALGQELS